MQNPDILKGTPGNSQHAVFQIVCPIFDSRVDNGLSGGNFTAPDVPELDPFQEDGLIRVVDCLNLQHYFLEKHYKFGDPDFGPGNWDRLLSRASLFLDIVDPTAAQVIERITKFVQVTYLHDPNPDPQKYLVHVTTTRNQIFTPETEGRLVPANPRGRQRDLWRRKYRPASLENPMAERAPE